VMAISSLPLLSRDNSAHCCYDRRIRFAARKPDRSGFSQLCQETESEPAQAKVAVEGRVWEKKTYKKRPIRFLKTL
jgi:hypothetical protein